MGKGRGSALARGEEGEKDASESTTSFTKEKKENTRQRLCSYWKTNGERAKKSLGKKGKRVAECGFASASTAGKKKGKPEVICFLKWEKKGG